VYDFNSYYFIDILRLGEKIPGKIYTLRHLLITNIYIMDNKNDDDDINVPFSDDAEENLRIENELLQLKLKAEFGAESIGSADVPPEIQHEFLKNVLAFEQAYAEHKEDEESVTVYERIGKPNFSSAGILTDEEIGAALDKVIDLLGEKDIAIDFIAEYDNRLKYTFITEELFKHEMGFFSVPGMMVHYTYEEFHPNHKMDIENRTKDFIEHWFEQKFNEYSGELGDIILPTGQVFKKMQAIERMQQFFDCYTSFTHSAYQIFDTAFELYPETETGMGHADGAIKYVATLESGEEVLIKGMFKLYLSLEYGGWHVCYFVMPGFEW